MWENLKSNIWSWTEQGFKVSLRTVYLPGNLLEGCFTFEFYFGNVYFNLKQKMAEGESHSKLCDFQRAAG